MNPPKVLSYSVRPTEDGTNEVVCNQTGEVHSHGWDDEDDAAFCAEESFCDDGIQIAYEWNNGRAKD
jgi:hypothetical protein